MRQDLDSHKELYKHSEEKRGELQVHITKTSITIKEDTASHNSYQTDLITENEQLKHEIQGQKQYQAKRESDHLNELERVNLAHKSEKDSLV